MNTKPFIFGALLMAGLVATNPVQAAISVAATGDIWLAGQPDGSIATGFFGSDTAPENSPVELAVIANHTLAFTATGSTSVDASCFAGADGGCYADESGFGVGPANGIGTYQGPANALIGVFLDSNQPAGTAGPDSLDFTQAANISQLSYSPVLNQIFFIGDGLTETSTGSVQQFFVPVGATRLFLAVADSYGSSLGNPGSLDVTVSDITAVPVPAAVWLFGTGLLGLLTNARQRITRS